MLDIFAGSNTTGEVAEAEGRQWLAFEELSNYVAASAFRFMGRDLPDKDVRDDFARIQSGQTIDLREKRAQRKLFA